MNAFLAASPVLSSILALGLGIRSLHAALLGLVAAILAAIMAFPLPVTEIAVASLKWLPLVLEVVLIVGGGLLMSEVLRHAGAQAALANWIKSRTGTGVGAVLLVVHGITPFAESVTGFGIGVTIGIPLLVFMGLAPRQAALIGLLGLCAVPWGSMGPGTMIAASLAGLGFDELGVASAALSVIPFAITGGVAAWLVSEPDGGLQARRQPLRSSEKLLQRSRVWGRFVSAQSKEPKAGQGPAPRRFPKNQSRVRSALAPGGSLPLEGAPARRPRERAFSLR